MNAMAARRGCAEVGMGSGKGGWKGRGCRVGVWELRGQGGGVGGVAEEGGCGFELVRRCVVVTAFAGLGLQGVMLLVNYSR